VSKNAIKNKDLAYDIARACKIPINEASKLLSIILDTLVKDIRKNKILQIRDFGRFKLTKYRRVHIPSGFVPASKYSCSFQQRGKLAQLMYSKWYSKYANTLGTKYVRLIKQGDIRGAKRTKRLLRKKIKNNRRMAEWLADRGRLPWTLPKIKCGAANAPEIEE